MVKLHQNFSKQKNNNNLLKNVLKFTEIDFSVFLISFKLISMPFIIIQIKINTFYAPCSFSY